MSFDKLLGDLSQGLRRRDVHNGAPRRLEASILANLPDSPAKAGAALSALGLVGFATVVAVGIGMLALAHHSSPPLAITSVHTAPHVETPVSLETARVRAAVDKQNTWHLSETWRLVNSKTGVVSLNKWEEWSRRSPYFYRLDDVGETIIDDGKTFVHIIPERHAAAAKNGAGQAELIPGRIVIRRSDGPLYRTMDHSGYLVTNPENLKIPPYVPGTASGGSSGFGIASSEQLIYSPHPQAKSSDTVTIEKVQQFKGISGYPDSQFTDHLVENALSHLPSSDSTVWINTNFRLEKGIGKEKPTQTEVIRAEYGRTLPSSITTLKALPGYSIIDLTGTNPSVKTGVSGKLEPINLGLRPELVGKVSAGTYTIRLNVAFGTRSIPNDALAVTLKDFSAKDDCGNVYVIVPLKTSDPRATMLTIAPVDPEATHRTHPRSVEVQCGAIINGQDPASKLYGERDCRVHVVGALRLPSSATIGASTAPPISSGFPSASLEALAVARAVYYGPDLTGVGQFNPERDLPASSEATHSGPPVSNGPSRILPNRSIDPALAAYWWNVAADEAERAGKRGPAWQYRLRATETVQH